MLLADTVEQVIMKNGIRIGLEKTVQKLSNKDLREIAIKHLTEGVDTLSAGYIPPNQDYLFSRDFKNYAKMRSDLIDDTPYVANRNVDAPSRVMPGELDALQGLQVQKQSDRLSMLKPPITEPDYSSAVGRVDTPFRLFPRNRSLSIWNTPPEHRSGLIGLCRLRNLPNQIY